MSAVGNIKHNRVSTKELEKAGFSKAVSEYLYRLVVNVEGHPGMGKTHLAFTAPGPVAFFSLDRSEEGVVEKFQKKRGDIWLQEFNVPTASGDSSKVQAEAAKEYDRLVTAYLIALKSARTVVIDTATELWELKRLAEFGRQSNVKHLFTGVNADFRKTFKKATFESDANVIFVHKLKKKYVREKGEKEAQWNGEYELGGFGDMEYMCQIRLQAERDENQDFQLRVLKCRQNGMVKPETVYPNIEIAAEGVMAPFPVTMTSFPFIATEVFPETSLEDWL